jgi:DNA-binding MarR family transcriptional regulator
MYIHLLMKPNSLDDNIVYLCAQFSHQFNLLLKFTFYQQGIPITPEQLGVLVFLWYNREATQQEISLGLHRDETTVTRVIINMLKNKLVTQKINPADKRSRIISLTAKGMQIQEKAISASGALYTQVLKGIAEHQWSAAVSVLQKLKDNVSQLSPKP